MKSSTMLVAQSIWWHIMCAKQLRNKKQQLASDIIS